MMFSDFLVALEAYAADQGPLLGEAEPTDLVRALRLSRALTMAIEVQLIQRLHDKRIAVQVLESLLEMEIGHGTNHQS